MCDIDYELNKDNSVIKGPYTIYEVKKAGTTNQSLKDFYLSKFSKDLKTCEDLYNWDGCVDENTMVVFQTERDGYSRTLEEAIYYKLFDMSVFSNYTRDYLLSLKDKMNLKLTICKEGPIKSHKLIQSNEDNKVNFMLSIILSGKIEKALPNYIERGLKWLNKC